MTRDVCGVAICDYMYSEATMECSYLRMMFTDIC